MTSVIKVDTIQNSSGTDALSITSTGGLLPAGQTAWPAFRVALSTDQSETATGAYQTALWDVTSGSNCYLQGGMTLSSGVITVPVAGIYTFSTVLRLNNIGSGYVISAIMKNGSQDKRSLTYIINGAPASDYENASGSVQFKMDAGDTVKVATLLSSDTSWQIDDDSEFSGALIAAE